MISDFILALDARDSLTVLLELLAEVSLVLLHLFRLGDNPLHEVPVLRLVLSTVECLVESLIDNTLKLRDFRCSFRFKFFNDGIQVLVLLTDPLLDSCEPFVAVSSQFFKFFFINFKGLVLPVVLEVFASCFT